MSSRVKYLINWSHDNECAGGTESRYQIIKRAFPEAVLISARSLTPSREIDHMRKAVDQFLWDHTSKDDIVIQDAGVGGTELTPPKKILMFGNPYRALINQFPSYIGVDHWERLSQAQIEDSKTAWLCLANSFFSCQDAVLSGIQIDKILLNAVDTNFFKEGILKKKHVLWVGSRFKDDIVSYDIGRIMNGFSFPLKKVYKDRPLSKEDLRTAYQQAVCLVHTFPIEGNSNVVLEAMACDVPILTAKCGLFFNQPVGSVGEFLPKRKGNIPRKILNIITHPDRYSPRQYVIDNLLTVPDYITKIRRIINNV